MMKVNKRKMLLPATHIQRVIVMSIVVWLVGISSVYGEIYSYVDEAGRLWFVDRISAIPERYRNDFNETQAPSTAVSVKKNQQLTNEKTQPSRKKEVTIYVASWCRYCNQLEALLKKNNIAYQRIDIEKSESGNREFKKLGGRGVPLIKIDNHVIKGYDPQAILSAYNS